MTLNNIKYSKSNRATVFVSYAREDFQFVEKLQSALEERGFNVHVDHNQIAKGEEWWARIQQLIIEADTIISVLTPSSVSSRICNDEIEFAEQLNKRFLPIVAQNLNSQSVHTALARLNYIYFVANKLANASGEFNEALDQLVQALEADIRWIREHTRLGALANRWESRDRPNSLVLRGAELAAAETWLVTRPKDAPNPDDMHRAFVTESRRAETKRGWNRSVAIVAVLLLTIIGSFSWYIENQRAVEEERRAAVGEANRLAEISASLVTRGDPVTAALVALEALPAAQRTDISNDVTKVGVSLYKAYHAGPGTLRLTGHKHGVKAAQMSPDGTLIATGGNDRTVRLWDTKSGRQKMILNGHFGVVNAIEFSPNGTLLATGSEDGTAILWEVTSGRIIARLIGHHSPVQQIVFDRRGARLATISTSGSSSREGKVLSTEGKDVTRIWDTRDGSFLFEISPLRSGSTDKVNSTAFLENGDLFVIHGFTFLNTGAAIGGAGIWDGNTGELKTALHTPKAKLETTDAFADSSLAWEQRAFFAPDGTRYVHVVERESEKLKWHPPRIIDARTGKIVAELSGFDQQTNDLRIFFNSTGEVFAVQTKGSDGAVLEIRGSIDGKVLCSLTGWEGFRAVSLSPSGKRLIAYASKHKAFGIWDVDQPDLIGPV